MDPLIKYVLAEMRVIADAPLVFTAALLVVGGCIWFVLNWRYVGIVENKDGIIALYKERLGGATPDQAKARIDALERRVKATIGSDWVPLTASEVSQLSAAVEKLPKRRIQIMYSNSFGKDLAQTFSDAFAQAGWNDLHLSEGGGLGAGVSTGRGNGLAIELKRAIESNTKYKNVGLVGANEAEPPRYHLCCCRH